MSINIMNFKDSLKIKNYSYCIYFLHEEIKNILIEKVKQVDNNFTYTNLRELKDKCIISLEYDTALTVIEFYNLSIHKINEQYELDRLFEIYNSLVKAEK